MAIITYKAINHNLLGLSSTARTENYQLHPFIRNDWLSIDTLKESYGYTPAIYSHTDGTTRIDLNVKTSGQFLGAPFTAPSSTAMASSLQGVFDIEFNESVWNSLLETYTPVSRRDNMQDLLLKEMQGTAFEGVPYFVKYFAPSVQADQQDITGLNATDERMAGATQDVPQLMSNIDVDIYDHTFDYDRPFGDSQNITIEPIYNFFLDTSPDYEAAISNLPEPMLPNYYVLEVNAANTGSLQYEAEAILLSSSATTSNEYITSFTTRGYYPFYVGQLEILNHTGQMESRKASFQEYSNVAVLSPAIGNDFLADYNDIVRDNQDQGTADTSDDMYAIENYPFYNKIIIPQTNQYPDSNAGLFPSINNEENLELFLTLMQLFIIYNYSNPATAENALTSLGFTIVQTLADSDGGPQVENFIEDRVIAANAEVPLLLHVEEFISALLDPNPASGSPAEAIQTLAGTLMGEYNNGTDLSNTPNSLKTLILRNASEPAMEDNVAVTPWPGIFTDVQDSIANRLRELQEVFYNSASAYSEACMYIVEKRVLSAGQLTTSSDPVQTFFFGRDVVSANPSGVVYYDTQVKYGVRYQYDVKQVRLVFGNKYNYSGTQTIVNSDARKQGRAIGNALGFFAPERAALVDSPSFDDALSFINDPYLAEDGELPLIEAHHRFTGTYVYKWAFREVAPMDNSIAETIGIWQIAAGQVAAGDRVLENTVDYSMIMLKAKVGEGFDGYASGGFVAGDAPGLEETISWGVPELAAAGKTGGFGMDRLVQTETAAGMAPILTGGAAADPLAPASEDDLSDQLVRLRAIFTDGEFDTDGDGQLAWLLWLVNEPNGEQVALLQDAIDTYNSRIQNTLQAPFAKGNLVDAMEDLGIDVSWYEGASPWGNR